MPLRVTPPWPSTRERLFRGGTGASLSSLTPLLCEDLTREEGLLQSTSGSLFVRRAAPSLQEGCTLVSCSGPPALTPPMTPPERLGSETPLVFRSRLSSLATSYGASAAFRAFRSRVQIGFDLPSSCILPLLALPQASSPPFVLSPPSHDMVLEPVLPPQNLGGQIDFDQTLGFSRRGAPPSTRMGPLLPPLDFCLGDALPPKRRRPSSPLTAVSVLSLSGVPSCLVRRLGGLSCLVPSRNGYVKPRCILDQLLEARPFEDRTLRRLGDPVRPGFIWAVAALTGIFLRR